MLKFIQIGNNTLILKYIILLVSGIHCNGSQHLKKKETNPDTVKLHVCEPNMSLAQQPCLDKIDEDSFVMHPSKMYV